ncbi:LacI family transcriptional regulator [Fodinisporobacter ferrooxydans]|uniref:LacI family transcriptional regulator n=1 Tax=Fodinisporobacter ferrooxydans TaxID=2901836 RepID=A0ABY4CPJ5_9BACL|nr:LacI family transcriptional regulator [Alicyclobacillaceae bacterium MYW30-H2]
MPVTIRDVAKQAGVSITTVSRALNGYPDVSLETKRKIHEIAKELGYQPSTLARGLVMKKTHSVGLVVEDLSKSRKGHHFMFDILCGVHDRANELGYDVILFTVSSAEQRETSYADLCKARQVDGAILMGIRLDDIYLHDILQSDIPCVMLDVPFVGSVYGSVSSENVHGAKSAMRHLCKLGHKKIGFINGHQQAAVSQERFEGYLQALEEAGIAFDARYVYYGNFEQIDGENGVKELESRDPEISAYFCASDLMALGAVNYLRSTGRHVPADVSVVGFDGIDLAFMTYPSLTTVVQDRYEMGKQAANLLVGILNGESGKRIVLPAYLHEGQSTAAAPQTIRMSGNCM